MNNSRGLGQAWVRFCFAPDDWPVSALGFLTWRGILGVSQPFAGRSSSELIEARRSPRFKLEVGIRVYVRNRAVVRGHTVDISESGIAAMLSDEITLNEVVRLEFTLPDGEVEVLALAASALPFATVSNLSKIRPPALSSTAPAGILPSNSRSPGRCFPTDTPSPGTNLLRNT